MNKTNFLRAMQAKRARLEKNLATLSEAELDHKTTAESWSIKDNLAHLTFYEQYMLKRVHKSLENKDIVITGVTKQEQTARNSKIFTENKERSPAEIITEMQNSFAQVIALAEIIPEPVLTNPDYFAWLNGIPLWQYILDETCGEHYKEHLGRLME